MQKNTGLLRTCLQDIVLRCILLAIVIVAIFPFVYMLLISLMGTDSMKLSLERILHADWTLNNYARLFVNGGNFGRYILNSVVISVYSVAVNCLFCSMAAYAFAKKQFLGRDKILYVCLMTMMIPSMALLVPSFVITFKLGMMNTYSGLVLPTFTAFGIILMRSFMKNIPNELLESADIDGAGEVHKFVRIVLPLVKPCLISLAIFTFINAWGNLLWPLVIANGDMVTATQYVASTKNDIAATNYGFVMAATTCAFLPPFVVYIFLQRHFVEGIALSGIKS